MATTKPIINEKTNNNNKSLSENEFENGPKQQQKQLLQQQATQSNRKRREVEKRTVKIGKSIDEYDLRRMPVVLRSKYSFYLEPPHGISEAQKDSKKRLNQLFKKQLMDKQKEIEMLKGTSSISLSAKSNKSLQQALSEAEEVARFEKERHQRLIGQLKAAEAANRTRILKLRYLNMKRDETENLIESQSSALEAVRLEAFLSSFKEDKTEKERVNIINQIEQRRLQALLDDNNNSLIHRKLN